MRAQVIVYKPKTCEDCKEKRAHYGVAGERKARWCAACGEKHGAVRQGGGAAPKRQMAQRGPAAGPQPPFSLSIWVLSLETGSCEGFGF